MNYAQLDFTVKKVPKMKFNVLLVTIVWLELLILIYILLLLEQK